MVLGQYVAILILEWVVLGHYKSVLGGAGSVSGLYACLLSRLKRVEILSGVTDPLQTDKYRAN